MMRFPVTDLLSEEECYRYLLDALHPEGLSCPNGHPLPDGQAPHDRSRAPIVKYRYRECGAVYNLFTGTVWSAVWSGTHYDCKTIVRLQDHCRWSFGGLLKGCRPCSLPRNWSLTTRRFSVVATRFKSRPFREGEPDCPTRRSKRTRCFPQKFLRMRGKTCPDYRRGSRSAP